MWNLSSPLIRLKQRRKGHVNVAIFQGTSQLILLYFLFLFDVDAVVVFDNEGELAPYRKRLAGKGNIHFFGLGEGETAMTLLLDGTPEAAACLETMANMSAADGMGQTRLFGHAGTQQKVSSAQFGRFCRKLGDELDKLTGGNLRQINFSVFIGLCGGTGTAVLALIMAIVGAILAWRRVRVHTSIVPLGLKTFLDLGDEQLELTAAASLSDLTAYTIDHNIDPLETRSLELMELPPTGDDQDARNKYLLAVTQAIRADSVQVNLARVAPNHSRKSEYGNVTLRHFQFSRFVPPEQVAAEVVPVYLAAIEWTRRQLFPNPSLIESLRPGQGHIPLSREPVESIIATAVGRTFDELNNGLCRPSVRHVVGLQVELVSGDTYELTSYSTTVATAPETLSEVERLLIEQTSLRHLLQQEILLLEMEVADLEDQIDVVKRRLWRRHRALLGIGWWNWLFGWLGSYEARLARVAETSVQLRDLSDQWHLKSAELAAFRQSLAEVEKALEFRLSRLKAIAEALVAHRQRGKKIEREQLVVVANIDTVWPLIDQLDQLSHQEQLQQICCGAQGATIAGLAHMCGVTQAELEVIAQSLANKQFETEGPHWAGVPRLDQGEQLLILPQVVPDVQEKLTHLIRVHDERLKVHFADHAAAGLAVVLVSLHRVRSAEELFVGQLRPALAAAFNHRHPQLYFPLGTSSVPKLGIVIDASGQVEFHPRHPFAA